MIKTFLEKTCLSRNAKRGETSYVIQCNAPLNVYLTLLCNSVLADFESVMGTLNYSYLEVMQNK